MAAIVRARVQETSTTAGAGAITVAGAVAGFRTFASVCSVSDTFDYLIEGVDSNGNPTGEWEIGVGTYSSANTITRTTPSDGSAATPVSFSAGTKRVSLVHPTVAQATLGANTFTGAQTFTTIEASGQASFAALQVTGSVGVGGAAFASVKLMLTGTAPASGTLSFGHYNGLTLDPAVTSSAYLNYTVPAIATGGTVGTLAHYFVAQGVFTGTATSQYGFAVGSAMTGATHNFGFHSAIASGANRWNFYAAGTAANYFQGDTTFASQASFAAGSAAAPSVRVGAEQNGLYSSAANTLDIALGGIRGFQFGYNASGVNYFRAANAVSGAGPLLLAAGSDTNVPIRYRTQAAGSHIFETGSSGNIGLLVSHVASAVNYWSLYGNATAGTPTLYADGSDANVSASYGLKGGGSHIFYTGSNTAAQLIVAHAASAVNWARICGGATGSGIEWQAAGGDASIQNNYRSKGNGGHTFWTGGGAQLVVANTASAVNYAQITGSATGLSVVYGAAGIDANVSTVVTGKGVSSVGLYSNSGLNAILFASHVASSVNYWNITGAATGDPNTLTTQGSDANIGAYLATKGTGSWRFATGGGDQFRVSHAASAVNYWQAQGAATTGVPILFATGSDASVSGVYSTKGAGNHVFYTNSTTAPQFFVSHTTSSVNFLQVTGAATGNAVTINTGGSDTNRSIAITPAGTGTVNLGVTRVSGADGGIQFGVQGATRGVRFITSSFGSAIEGVDNTLAASYQPMNLVASVLGIYTVGTNNISFGTNSNVPQVYVSPNATAVNALVFTGGSTGNAVTISTTGSDTNRDIAITPGGAGVLRFGTHSAIAAETVTGYITIKDSAGNTRKLAVLS